MKALFTRWSVLVSLTLGMTLIATTALAFKRIDVPVAGAKGESRYRAKKILEEEARKQAVYTYLKELDRQVGEKILERLAGQQAQFVVSVIPGDLNTTAEGDYRIVFSVTLDEKKINAAYRTAGAGGSAHKRLVILEDPPSGGKMELLYQKKHSGRRFSDVAQFYSEFQKNIKGIITQHARDYGFDVEDLTLNDKFRDLVSKDAHLLGVYFDNDAFAFTVDSELIRKIKEEMPDTLVLMYRIDHLYLDESTNFVRAGLAMDIKSLKYGKAISLGAPQRDAQKIRSLQPEAVLEGLKIVMENTVTALMGDGGMKKINDLMIAANMEKDNAPIAVQINAKSGKVLYQLKKALVQKGLVAPEDAEAQGNRLSLRIKRTATLTGGDQFVYDHFLPLLQENRIPEPTDKNISIMDREVKIQL